MTIEELLAKKEAEIAKLAPREAGIQTELLEALTQVTEVFIAKLEEVGLADDFKSMQQSIAKLQGNAANAQRQVKGRLTALQVTAAELRGAIKAESKEAELAAKEAAAPTLKVAKDEASSSLPAAEAEG